MMTDKQGNSLSGPATSANVDLYDAAIHSFNIYRGDPIGMLEQAVDSAPDFAMAWIAKAWILATTSEPAATQQGQTLVRHIQSLSLNERERSHAATLGRYFDHGWTQAANALDQHNIRYPRDMLAVQVGHLADFYCGNARNLRDRIARVLPAWSPQVPGYSVLLGMHAFGLEECGDYARAEDTGRQATELEPLDCWAHHAVTHVMEMQGRAEDGLGWMVSREPHWSGEDNSFKVHNWWHHALYHLELDQKPEALALYDGPVRSDRSPFALDLIDASALLWRLHLCDITLGDRWDELAQAWQEHADGTCSPFNDWHAAMAYLGAGREQDVKQLLSVYRSRDNTTSENARWAQTIALPLIQGFTAFWHEDYKAVTEHLFHTRQIVNAFGGSHAQRDIIDWTLTEAAVRAGMTDMARALVNERMALKPHSRVNLSFQSRLQ